MLEGLGPRPAAPAARRSSRQRLPIAVWLAALITVFVHVAMFDAAREADEGSAAHIWQILLVGQLPIVAFFAIKWLPRTPGHALLVLALQTCAAALASVFFLGL